MKKSFVLAALTLCFAAEMAVLLLFTLQGVSSRQDAVAVNEVFHTVQRDWGDMESHCNETALDYVVLGMEGEVLFRTKSGLSESVNQAVIHRDTILDVYDSGIAEGKLLIYNDTEELLLSGKRTAFLCLGIFMIVQMGVCAWYIVYLERSVLRPFQKMKDFARRVAGGNLDIPLEMDRHNLFGAFTESFDIMRTELKKARKAEAEANIAKKELVAKLSHDIKTPVASIQAAAEVGAALAERAEGAWGPEMTDVGCPGEKRTDRAYLEVISGGDLRHAVCKEKQNAAVCKERQNAAVCKEKQNAAACKERQNAAVCRADRMEPEPEVREGFRRDGGDRGQYAALEGIRENYLQIMRKAEQINTLVTNLFTATLEELEQLAVAPVDMEGAELEVILRDADYLGRASIPHIPVCLLYADRLRLQQVFDNIFINSYKYAGTQVNVAVRREGGYLAVEIEDYGGGVSGEELPLLKEKFRRGSNASETEGAGLGLYISDYFMKEMGGKILVENGGRGLRVTVLILRSGFREESEQAY